MAARKKPTRDEATKAVRAALDGAKKAPWREVETADDEADADEIEPLLVATYMKHGRVGIIACVGCGKPLLDPLVQTMLGDVARPGSGLRFPGSTYYPQDAGPLCRSCVEDSAGLL